MKKEALINIIINDLKEVQQLMEVFKGESAVSSAFVNLAKTKIRNVEDEVSLLEQEFGNPAVSSRPVKEKEIEKPKVVGEKPNSVEREIKEEEKPVSKSVVKESVEAEKSAGVAPQIVETVDKTEEEIVGTKKGEPAVTEKEKIKPKIKSEKVEAKKRSTPESPATISDVLNKKKSAINEKVSLGETENDLLYNKPVGDIRKAMGINDRFFYQRELFEGNADLFNQTLDQLNSMSSFDDATNFLVSNFEWEKDSEVAGSFLKIVKRRFL